MSIINNYNTWFLIFAFILAMIGIFKIRNTQDIKTFYKNESFGYSLILLALFFILYALVEDIGNVFLAWATVALAMATFLTLNENKHLRDDALAREQRDREERLKRERRDHNEKLLVEIINWAKNLYTLLATSPDYPASKASDLKVSIDNFVADYFGLVRIAETIDDGLANAMLLRHKVEPEGIVTEDGVQIKHDLLHSYLFELTIILDPIKKATPTSTLRELWKRDKLGVDPELQKELINALVKIIKIASKQRAKLLK